MSRGPKRVYLDQNKWIDLAKYRAGREDGRRYANVHDVLQYGAGNGLVSCPLSGQHYIETAKRGRAESRHQLASTMAALSHFDAIAPPWVVVPMELDCALRARFGKPTTPRSVPIFGHGFRHALGNDHPLYEVPDHFQMEAGAKAATEATLREVLEFAALAGPSDSRYISAELAPDLDSFGQRYVDMEERVASGLATEKDRREAAPRWTAATEVIDVLRPLNEALDHAALSVGETIELDSAEGMTALLMDLPSRSVIYQLRARRHANPQTRWEPNDLDDLGALSVAIAYCDVVVTEKQWVRLAAEAKIGEPLGTTIISDLAELPERIV